MLLHFASAYLKLKVDIMQESPFFFENHLSTNQGKKNEIPLWKGHGGHVTHWI